MFFCKEIKSSKNRSSTCEHWCPRTKTFTSWTLEIPQHNGFMHMGRAYQHPVWSNQPFCSTPRHIIKCQDIKDKREDPKNMQRGKSLTVKGTRIGIDWSPHQQYWVLERKMEKYLQV